MTLLFTCLIAVVVSATQEISFVQRKITPKLSKKMRPQLVSNIFMEFQYRLYDCLAPPPLEGVYLFLGYSRKDSRVVMNGRKEVDLRMIIQ